MLRVSVGKFHYIKIEITSSLLVRKNFDFITFNIVHDCGKNPDCTY